MIPVREGLRSQKEIPVSGTLATNPRSSNLGFDETKFQRDCYPFYNKLENNYKNQQEIKDTFKCLLDNNENKRLYLQKTPEELIQFSQNKLKNRKCLEKYEFVDPEKDSKDFIPLDIDGLKQNCTNLKDNYPEFNSLLTYAQQITIDLHVDPIISEFITNLIENTTINMNGLQELFKGAFFIIRGDNGYFYELYGPKRECTTARVCNMTGIFTESSHDSTNPQYRLGAGVLYKCDETGVCDKNNKNTAFDLLVGTSPLPNFYGDTWFQFEYANLLTFINKYPLHGFSYIQHALSNYEKNIGPLGNSGHAEYSQPLILTICRDLQCDSPPCEVVPCINTPINLQEFSTELFKEKKIDMSDYKLLKIFIKSRNEIKNNKITLKTLLSIIKKYIDWKDEDENENEDEYKDESEKSDKKVTINKFIHLFTTTPKLLIFIRTISHTNNYEYSLDQLIEIVFLLYYNAKKNTNDYLTNDDIDDIDNILTTRYPKATRSQEAGRKKNTRTKRKRKYMKKTKCNKKYSRKKSKAMRSRRR